MGMSSSKPYLIRAIYEWINDNALTPYILVDANSSTVEVPRAYVENGRIVLNINPKAVTQFHLGNDKVEFLTRFSGKTTHVRIPMDAILAIFAKENGEGMAFNEQTAMMTDTPPSDPASDTKRSDVGKANAAKPSRPNLTIIK